MAKFKMRKKPVKRKRPVNKVSVRLYEYTLADIRKEFTYYTSHWRRGTWETELDVEKLIFETEYDFGGDRAIATYEFPCTDAMWENIQKEDAAKLAEYEQWKKDHAAEIRAHKEKQEESARQDKQKKFERLKKELEKLEK